jgi:hypothetical protein
LLHWPGLLRVQSMDNEPTGPALGDCVDLAALTRTMAESLRQTLATRLGIEWRRQNPGAEAPNSYEKFSITLDYQLVQSICNELARNTAGVIAVAVTVDASMLEAA